MSHHMPQDVFQGGARQDINITPGRHAKGPNGYLSFALRNLLCRPETTDT
jgi:hypothetical protein